MLTKEQTDWIRTNIRNRGIETIDLEHEMTDHISSAVEEKLEHGIEFRDAYKSVVAAFGPFGLQRLQKEKYSRLKKKGYRMIFRNMKAYLKLPQIVLTLLIAAILYALYSIVEEDVYVVYVVLALALFSPLVYLLSSKQRREIKDNFTSIKAMYRINGEIAILYYIFINPIIFGTAYMPSSILMIASMVAVILSLAFYSSIVQSIADVKLEYGEMASA